MADNVVGLEYQGVFNIGVIDKLPDSRKERFEELKRENEDLRRWADTPLPADIIRLRERPALTGGAAYRQWLSASDAVSAGSDSAAH
ncbi:Rz-like lysis system protein LysB [Escherichia coli]|uniref:Rz-like lysis system protein LysB n=1 Tax=Escherichia coli TaxID=562 RepID=UPI0022483C35|nr:Rz-like lysis system protein LysB [Escherichia coli]